MHKATIRILATFLPLAISANALAQPVDPASRPSGHPQSAVPDGWSVTVGVAPVVGPAWEGSDDMILSIFPDVRVAYGDTIFASIPDGIGWNAINDNGWKAGPIAKLRFGRVEDGGGSPFAVAWSSDALAGMGDVDPAAEVGSFVEKRFDAARQWSGRIETVRGFGGHEGIVADLSLAYRMRSGRTMISVGPRATVATSDFTRVYFGFSGDQAMATGLAPYEPKGGLVSYGLGGNVVRPLDRRSAVTLFTSFRRLGDVAADSPLVRERGRREQFALGVDYGIRFGL